jgi:putative lipoic acid-binding regulatory protein
MDAPKIEFPCRYPIKVIGAAGAEATGEVLAIIREHAPDLTPDDVNTRHSKHGNYVSIRVTIMAESEAQLRALHRDLMSHDSVRMVL